VVPERGAPDIRQISWGKSFNVFWSFKAADVATSLSVTPKDQGRLFIAYRSAGLGVGSVDAEE
jgi:hypothetical protein